VDWTSTFGVDAVIFKGGPNANVYRYPPAESKGDSHLSAPLNVTAPYGLSHVEFCYDYELEVSKTAVTSFKRTYEWAIRKWADETEATLAPGQTLVAHYYIEAGATYFDTERKVSGEITIHNPDPNNPAIITEVFDKLHLQSGEPIEPNEIEIPVDCPVTFPYSLPAGETLVCTYAETPLPDGGTWLNKAVALTDKTASKVGMGHGSKWLVFEKPTTEIDECIDIYDSNPVTPNPMHACYPGALIKYTSTVGPYDTCGEYEFINTAYFITNDTGTSTKLTPVSHTILVDVPCKGACTLTPGYWKTHSEFGPAPYDANWASLPEGASTLFYLSGQSYYDVLWTPPVQGNAYYILAHAFIAAKLNLLNGASSTPDVDAALAWSETFFNTYTPTSTLTRSQRNEAIRKADLLDQYNNGLVGPGHCSGDTEAATLSFLSSNFRIGEAVILENRIWSPLLISH
jgi:hypothetical protein